MSFVELRKVEDGRQVCYAPHSHTQWSIGAITGGRSTFCYRDERYLVNTGDLVVMNPGWVHACNPIDDQPWAYLMMYIDAGWLADLRHQSGLSAIAGWQGIATATITDTAWYGRYRQVADCLLDAQRDLLEKQTEVVEFLSDLMHEFAASPATPKEPVPEVMTALAAYLDGRAAEDVSLAELCESSGYSPGHLIRVFKQHFGLTPHAYLINRRVQLGRSALSHGATIVDAALSAGFADQPHFQRVFKRLMAATPNQYRFAHSISK